MSMTYPIKKDKHNFVRHTLPSQHPQLPQPQIPVTQQLDNQFYIRTMDPNPFTIRPIETEWKTNELIMIDPRLRVTSGVGPLDIGLKQASNYISPQHLNPGWQWYGDNTNNF